MVAGHQEPEAAKTCEKLQAQRRAVQLGAADVACQDEHVGVRPADVPRQRIRSEVSGGVKPVMKVRRGDELARAHAHVRSGPLRRSGRLRVQHQE